jgi:hypothetical protein
MTAPNQAIAVRNDSDLATLDDSPEWKHLWARANVMCRSGLVPKALQGKPADTMAVLLACQDMGLPVSVTNLNQFHVIEGSPEPSAQLTLGLAHAAGYETRWGRNDNESAEIHIRRPGAAEVETFSFTIEDARTAHLLDEWVERWTSSGDRNRLEKYVIGCGKPVPEWAQKLIDAGEIKHKDNWYNYPADMLRARAAKRAVKAVAPEVRLGIVDRIHVEPTPAAAQVVLREPQGEDEITEAEIVVDGTEPFEDEQAEVKAEQQPEQQAKVQPDPVPAATAKLELVAAAKEAGLDELAARALAQQCWQLYRLDGEPVSRSALDIVRKEVIAKASAAAGSSTTGDPGAAAAETPEGTLFDGGGSEH